MNNPGLNVFSVATTFPRSRNHPLNTPLSVDDPDYDDEEHSDFVGGPDFHRWLNPGYKIHVPAVLGPAFAPGAIPEDVIHGELVSPAEQDAADKIIRGDHESTDRSGNPFVENAREDLRTPSSAVAVHALSTLLSGTRPSSMSAYEMEIAHDYLSRHFTGVRVNPHRGTLLAASPAGSQIVRRQPSSLVVHEKPQAAPVYSLANKHGVFESDDPERLVRAMVAFQIAHNAIYNSEKKDDDKNNGLTSTSGLINRIVDSLGKGFNSVVNPLRDDLPESAVFEPGHGVETNEHGLTGGYVAHESDAPPYWYRDKSGVAYSPGHHMREMLDPERSIIPRDDPYFPGHKFTYAPNHPLGYTIHRLGGKINYYVNNVHPAARGVGFDLPPSPPQTKTRRAPREELQDSGQRAVAPKTPTETIRPPKVRGVAVVPQYHADEPTVELPPVIGAVKANDLCPVCASGYLEPYDREFHECLNCGSLVKHIGFDKESSKKPPRRGLGRGLSDIPVPEYKGDPFGLLSGGSENPENMDEDAPEEGYVHPLAGAELDPDYKLYLAPKNLLDKTARDVDLLDEHLGKFGFSPMYKPGGLRAYMMRMPGTDGSYIRLTEGMGKKGWVLTADNILGKEQWTQGGREFPGQHIGLDPVNQGGDKQWYRLIGPSNESMPDKSFLASGHHPIDDEHLSHAIRDVTANGRNSVTYQKVFDAPYQVPQLPPEQGTQRERRMLSSVGGNPGLARFIS